MYQASSQMYFTHFPESCAQPNVVPEPRDHIVVQMNELRTYHHPAPAPRPVGYVKVNWNERHFTWTIYPKTNLYKSNRNPPTCYHIFSAFVPICMRMIYRVSPLSSEVPLSVTLVFAICMFDEHLSILARDSIHITYGQTVNSSTITE